MRGKDDGHVGEQGQRRPFEHRSIACVTDKRFEQDTADAEQHSVEVLRPTDQQAQCRAHGTEVCAGIDHVGDYKQEHDCAQKPWGVVASQALGDAVARNAADAGTDSLDHGHQRKAEQHGPG